MGPKFESKSLILMNCIKFKTILVIGHVFDEKYTYADI